MSKAFDFLKWFGFIILVSISGAGIWKLAVKFESEYGVFLGVYITLCLALTYPTAFRPNKKNSELN